nr:hypothetical protein [Bacteroidota bacterium]
MMRSSDSIEVLISRLPEKRAKSIINRIKKHNITTLEQLHGAINPQLPPLSESSIRKKGLNQSFQKIQKKSTQKSTKLKRLKSLTGLSE